MPRLIPRGNGNDDEAITTSTPRRITASLLVVQPFKDAATRIDYEPGDRAQLRHRSIRLAALDRPELFAVEYSTEPVDVGWLAEIHRREEARYDQEKAAREVREAAVLPAELAEAKARKRESDRLEGRFEKQQEDLKKAQAAAKEERERTMRESGIRPLDIGGYHYDD